MKAWNELAMETKMKLSASLQDHWMELEEFKVKLASGKTIENARILGQAWRKDDKGLKVVYDCEDSDYGTLSLTGWCGYSFLRLAEELYGYCLNH